nr:hypothetical protein [Tanacetum cinerariifolium]
MLAEESGVDESKLGKPELDKLVLGKLEALPPPDYVPGLEEPEQAPPSLVYIPYIPEPEYPEYIPLEDEVFPAEEQPLPAAASPTTDSPRYIPESDPDEDLEDDDDEDPNEDPADYPADHSDEEEPSKNDADEEDEEQDEDDDAEEEHPASADSIPPPPALPSPPILPIPLPAASPPLRRDAARPIEGRRADYGFVGSVEAEIRQRRAKDIKYGIRDTWIDPRDVAEEEALTTLEGVNTTVTELAAVQEHDTQDIYRVIKDTQGRQTEIFYRVEALVDDSDEI